MATKPQRREAHRTYLSYIDKSREYYAAHGYGQPYRWAAYDDVPLNKPAKPLSESRVAVVTTSFLYHEDLQGNDVEPNARHLVEDAGAKGSKRKTVYHHPTDPQPDRMFTMDLSWDKDATHTNDVGSFLPLDHLRTMADEGRIGSLNHRFFGVPTDYSQRRTGIDADTIAEWCAEDDVDVVLLIPL